MIETMLRGFGYLSLLVATFLGTYTFSSVNVALPFIERDLHASTAGLQLVMGVYATCFALLLIIGGRLGDAYGRHRLFGLGLAAFVVSATAAGFAPNIGVLIAFRGVQGFAAALLIPQILATIQATTSGAARLRAVAMFSAFGGLGGAAGQMLGGVLLGTGAGWRAVLWFGGLLALVVLPGAFALPKTRSARTATDFPGALIVAVAVTALLLPLTIGPAQDWPLWTILLLAVMPFALAAFWFRERRYEGRGQLPLVPPSVVRHKAVRIGLTIAGVFFAGYGGFMYEFALMSQGGLHYTPMQSGLSLGLFAVAFAVVSANLERFRAWFGDRIIPAGTLIMIVALLATVLVVLVGWPAPSQWLLQPSMMLLGAGQALVFGPLVSTVMAKVPPEVAGLSGGLFTTVQQAALALGVAVYGGVYGAVLHGANAAWAFGVCLGIQALTTIVLFGLAQSLRPRGEVIADRHPELATT